ncbi:hypothetical protein [Nocardia sp. NPDC050710]|uniref:hypothetical protein n=1 Tax=Nocardia sp. NPDC050710 TaxID=3157220 RepID=UPI00340EBA1B
MTTDPATVDLKFSAARGETVEVQFEPLGTTFNLSDGDCLYLRTPLDAVPHMEFQVWPNGIAVWVAHGADHRVLDRDGNQIDALL